MAKILVVDDEQGLLANIARYLEVLGHEVATAGNGQLALRALADRAPDLLVTDLNMPDMDGVELLEALGRLGSRVPVIAMSGGARSPGVHPLQAAPALGAVVTLEKPFTLEELRAAVERVLGPA